MIRAMASVKISIISLIWLFLLTFWGTLAQLNIGLYAAQERYFSSFFFIVAKIIPLPGAMTVLIVIMINILALFIVNKHRWLTSRWIGIALIHFGILVYGCSGIILSQTVVESSIQLNEGQETNVSLTKDNKEIKLPFLIKLLDFEALFYPGTEIPRSFNSLVEVHYEGLVREIKIVMNQPFRFGDLTVYQASYGRSSNGKLYSQFQVVESKGKYWPYAAGLLVLCGIIIHCLIVSSSASFHQKLRLTAIAFTIGCLIAPQAIQSQDHFSLNGKPDGAEGLNMNAFADFPVFDGGRLKPIETYARSVLTRFSGKSYFENISAVTWLSRAIFTPSETAHDKIFVIDNAETAMAIGLESAARERFSYMDLKPFLERLSSLAKKADMIEAKRRTTTDQELLRLANNLMVYEGLIHTLDIVRPDKRFMIHSPKTAKALNLPDVGLYTYLDIVLHADRIKLILDSLELEKRSAISDEEIESEELLNALYETTMGLKNQELMMILARDGRWISIHDAIKNEFPIKSVQTQLIFWQVMQKAYELDQKTIDLQLQSHKAWLKNQLTKLGQQSDFRSLTWESRLVYLSPFFWAKGIYILALIITVVSMIAKSPRGILAASIIIFIGIVIHAVGIITRMALLGRMPVSDLYESMLFVSLLIAILGVCMMYRWDRVAGLLLSTIAGTLFLTLAEMFSTGGDTMKVVVAVLNSNFWLGTHVIAISIGYSGMLAAGILAHLWLVLVLFNLDSAVRERNIFSGIEAFLILGFVFTFIGTNLGGIWADQSWGRFWGWDPKENGALMITLWGLIIFHARKACLIRRLGLAFGAIFGMIVTLWAWFGVNLLQVGLHSYGFSSNTLWGLTVYGICEMTFLAVLSYKIIWPCSPFQSKISAEREGIDAVNRGRRIAGTLFP